MYPIIKPQRVKSKKCTNSANGERCTIRLAAGNGCTDQPGAVVACHITAGTSKTGSKPSDLVIAYGCNVCHGMIDGSIKHSYSKEEVLEAKLRGLTETLEILLLKQLAKI